jgi:hypothetical protein
LLPRPLSASVVGKEGEFNLTRLVLEFCSHLTAGPEVAIEDPPGPRLTIR